MGEWRKEKGREKGERRKEKGREKGREKGGKGEERKEGKEGSKREKGEKGRKDMNRRVNLNTTTFFIIHFISHSPISIIFTTTLHP
jgi:hypothetical protein